MGQMVLSGEEAKATAAKLGLDNGEKQVFDEPEINMHYETHSSPGSEADDDLVVQDSTGVKPKSLFSCIPCWCNNK